MKNPNLVFYTPGEMWCFARNTVYYTAAFTLPAYYSTNELYYILHATLAERRRHEVSREQEAREQYQWNSVPAWGPGARTKTAPPDAPRFAYVYSVFEVFRPAAGSGNAREWDARKPRMDNVTLRYGTHSGILE